MMSERDNVSSMKIDSGFTLKGMLGENNSVEIPIIQRDYAQGRENAKEIRDDFLKDLFDHLSKDEKIKLSFVYGTTRITPAKKIYIPYDGQQRVTLIYLLTLYLAAFSKNWNEIKELARFKYYTRDTAADFCAFLTGFDDIDRNVESNNVFKRINFAEKKLAAQIRNDIEFFGAWEYDPTTFSMMVVLESIHNEFLSRYGKSDLETQQSTASELLKRLNEGCVFFDWCSISASDNIYIKMNGRGKPLSAFDNFKNTLYVELNKLRTEDAINGRVDRIEFLKEFEIKLDGKWTDMFWTLRNRFSLEESFDISPYMMNCLFYIFELRYAEKTSSFFFGARRPFSWIDEKNVVSFLSTFKEKCKLDSKESVITLDDYIWLSKLLDVLKYRLDNPNVNKDILGIDGYKDEFDLLNKVSTDTDRKKTDTRYVLSAESSIVAAMYYEYLVHAAIFDKHGELEKMDDSCKERWISLIGKMTKTAGQYKGRFDALQRDKHIFQGFEKLVIGTVFTHSSVGDLVESSQFFTDSLLKDIEPYFNASHTYNQLFEEIFKYKLLYQDCEKWESRIANAESKLSYFGGQIYFLFALSENDGIIDDKKFDSYLAALLEIWDENGIKEEYQNIFTALLLSFGDYRISCGEGYGNAKGLCSNKSGENFKWRNFFDVLDGDTKQKITILKDALDLIIQKGSVEKAYDSIKEKLTTDRWRNIIIQYPEILNQGSNHRIVFMADDGCWYLIKSNGVAKQVHVNSLSDSINIELYGIYRSAGFAEELGIGKGTRLLISSSVFVESKGDERFLYSNNGNSVSLRYDEVIAQIRKDMEG